MMGGLLWLEAGASLAAVVATRTASRRRWRCCVADRRRLAIYGLLAGLFGVTGWREAVQRDPANRASDLRD